MSGVTDKPITRPLTLEGIAYYIERIIRPLLNRSAGAANVGTWQDFSPSFEAVPQLDLADDSVSISGSPAIPEGYAVIFIIVTSGVRGVGEFAWFIDGVPQPNQIIPSDGVFVAGGTGYTFTFADAYYTNPNLYSFNMRNAFVGSGQLTGRWRSNGTDAEVEILLRVATDTNFGTGVFFFPLPDGVTLDSSAILDGGDTSWPYRMLQCFITVRDESTTSLNGYTYPLLIDEQDQIYFQSNLVASLADQDQVLFHASVPVANP